MGTSVGKGLRARVGLSGPTRDSLTNPHWFVWGMWGRLGAVATDQARAPGTLLLGTLEGPVGTQLENGVGGWALALGRGLRARVGLSGPHTEIIPTPIGLYGGNVRAP